MKKIIIAFLAVFALAACNHKASAQITMYKSTVAQSGITSQTRDTLTNTETTYFNVPTGSLNKYTTANYAAYLTADTTSGTPGTITVIQQGSYDGVTWFNLSGVGLGTDGVNCDSLNITTPTNIVFKLTTLSGAGKYVNEGAKTNCAPRVTYYRLRMSSTGTQATTISNVKLIPFTR